MPRALKEDPPAQRGLLRAGTVTLASRVLVFLLSLLASVILARALGPAGRGLYSLALLGPSLVVLMANLGVSNALTYHLARGSFSVDQLIAQVLALALILGVTATVGLLVVVAVFGRALLPGVPLNLVEIAAASVPLGLFFYFCLSFNQGLERFGAFNSLYVINAVALVVFLVPLLVERGNVTIAVAAWSASWVPTGVAGIVFLARRGRLNLRAVPAVSRSLLRFGVVGYLSFLSYYLTIRLDTFLVNIFSSPTQVGFYAVAVSLSETIWYISTAASTVLAPRVAAGDSSESDVATGRVSRVVVATSILAAVVLAAAAPLVVRILFGSAFQPSVLGVWLLLPGIIALGSARVLSGYLLGRNRQDVDLVASAASVIATVVFDLLLIPRYGFIGAAVASSIAYGVALVIDLRWVVRNSSMSVKDLLVPTRQDLKLLATGLRGAALRLRSSPN